jgi:hypothetical protein
MRIDFFMRFFIGEPSECVEGFGDRGASRFSLRRSIRGGFELHHFVAPMTGARRQTQARRSVNVVAGGR